MARAPMNGRARHRPGRIIAVFCASQTLAQLGAFTFPALLPGFFEDWQLSHAEAGWLSGIFFGAYAAAVPVLVTLTDRVPARRIYMLAVGLTTASHLGMAVLAEGFWSGLAFRILAGVGWAGTYMVGLRALSDELEGPAQTRGVAAHAASIGISGALSFLIAGQVDALAGWRVAFAVVALGSTSALAVAWGAFPRRRAPRAERTLGELFDFRPVLGNRSAMAYSVGYCVHTWEMFVLRSWVVTFLVFNVARGDAHPGWLAPTVVAMLMELVGTATSVAGNEMALAIGRRRWILIVMGLSMAMALALGYSSVWGYGAVVAMVIVYNGLIYADSATLTAGTVGSAEPARRGQTLAVHAMLGYGGGFVGPVTMGLVLEAMGGESVASWGVGFAHVGLVVLVGPLVLLALNPKDPGRPLRAGS